MRIAAQTVISDGCLWMLQPENTLLPSITVELASLISSFCYLSSAGAQGWLHVLRSPCCVDSGGTGQLIKESLLCSAMVSDHSVLIDLLFWFCQARHVGHLGGALSKNLLLKVCLLQLMACSSHWFTCCDALMFLNSEFQDKKHRLYVVSALVETKVDMKSR